MKKEYKEQITSTIKALKIVSPVSYTWFGESNDNLPSRIRNILSPKKSREYLHKIISSKLYTNFYCSGISVSSNYGISGTPLPTGNTMFIEDLVKNNVGIGYWEPGWKVNALTKEGLVKVSKDEISLLVEIEKCYIANNGKIKVEEEIMLKCPKGALYLSPGFYSALSNKHFFLDENEKLIRFYWNIMPEGAANLMYLITKILNESNLSFQFKIIDNPSKFTRRDAGVLYIKRKNFGEVITKIKFIYSKLAHYLKPGIPAFTKRIASGIGFAEDPNSSKSFGESRCEILAEGLIRIHEKKLSFIEDSLNVIIDSFHEFEINILDTPYLNKNSNDDYNIKFDSKSANTTNNITPIDYLQVADSIGTLLASKAIWSRKSCNWIGADFSEGNSFFENRGIEFKSLGPELYSGTSGIAIFLSTLYSITKKSIFKSTAEGAIEHAFSQLSSIPVSTRYGYYSGWPGIALACSYVGKYLEVEKFIQYSKNIIQRLNKKEEGKSEFDFLSGYAGGIIALIQLEKILKESYFLHIALNLSDKLIKAVDIEEGRGENYSWKSLNKKHRNLTGFSHGTAGIAFAFLQLYKRTGEQKYKACAEKAFAYENNFFNYDKKNWPDFRNIPLSKKKLTSFPYATDWCHGAPGIALSRLHAYDILKNEKYKTDALDALNTTINAINTDFRSGRENFSLCHGVLGNAEILLFGEQILNLDSRLVLQVAQEGANIYVNENNTWPCGNGTIHTPGLMLGLAGIGNFYLRLHNKNIPSLIMASRF